MGATDSGVIGGAASALAAFPPFETQHDYLARTKVLRQWGFMGAISSALAAPHLFDTEDYLRNDQK